MSRNPSFIELEGHVIRIANIVRVSNESYISKEKADPEDSLVYRGAIYCDTTYGGVITKPEWSAMKREKIREIMRAVHKDLRIKARASGQGSWLEQDEKIWVDGDVYRCTYNARYYVRLRGSRDIVLRNRFSYEKLKEAMGL